MTDRIALGDLTSDQLDALYDERDRLEQRVQDWKQAAGAGMALTDNLRAERDALAAGVPLVCSDERHKTQVFALIAEITRLTAGQCTDHVLMHRLHHAKPVAGCPYKECLDAAKEQAGALKGSAVSREV